MTLPPSGEKSARDGAPASCANHTGVRTPTPVLRKVSRFRYLALANCAIASGIVGNLCHELIASWVGRDCRRSRSPSRYNFPRVSLVQRDLLVHQSRQHGPGEERRSLTGPRKERNASAAELVIERDQPA